MTVVAVDDEEISLMCLEGVLEQMEDVETIHSFNNAEDAIAFFQKNRADAAFLDIQLYLSGGTLNGLSLAARIKELCPTCHVVFVTGCPEYAVDAFKLHVSGYIVKPVTKEAARKELDYIIMEKLGSDPAAKDEYPQYSDSVKVHYLGRLLPSPTYPKGYLFDSSGREGLWYSLFPNPRSCLPILSTEKGPTYPWQSLQQCSLKTRRMASLSRAR